MPVANYGEKKQQKCDQQQAKGFRAQGSAPAMFVIGIAFASGIRAPRLRHDHILRPAYAAAGL